MDIKQALGQLDPDNNDHWTQDGLPRIDAVEAASGTRGLKRQQITDADPQFTRDTARDAQAPSDEPQQPTEPDEDEEEAETVEPEASTDPDDEPAPEAPQEPEPAPAPQDIDPDPAVLAAVGDIPPEVLPARSQLGERYDELSAEINKLRGERNELDERIRALTHEQALLERDVDNSSHDHQTDQRNRMRFIRSQHEQRVRRHGSAAQIAAAVQAQLRSPLDNAMQRKTGRGTQRPVRPAPTSR